jgi:type II secretory pathway component PulF
MANALTTVRGPQALSEQEALLLTQRVADLAAAGLPLPDGLRALAAELAHGRVRQMALDLAGRLERGQSLPDALMDQQDRVPTHLCDLLIAGVSSGRLATLLSDFVSYARVGADLRRGLLLSLLYPLLIMVAFSIVIVFLYGYLVPQFATIFNEFGIPLPLVTTVIVRLAGTFAVGLPRITIWALGPPLLLWLAWRLLLDARSRSWVVCRVPLFGPIWRWSSLAEFCHVLGLLIEAELPLERALPLAADASTDAELAVEGRWITRELVAGRSLSSAIAQCPVFPEGVSRLLAWAEGRQATSEALHTVGDLLAARARARASLVGTVVAVVVIVMVLWAVSITVGGLFMPLIQLISKLSG